LRLTLWTGLHLIVYEIVVIDVILFSPQGLVPWFQKYAKKKGLSHFNCLYHFAEKRRFSRQPARKNLNRRKEMEFEKMTLEKENGIATLTLNHPEKMNAMTTEMYDDLRRIIDMINKDEEVKVFVITGTGRAFCSGSDVSGRLALRMAGKLKKTHREFVEPVGYVAYLFQNIEIPVIAAINGTAVGAGLSLALLSDIRIASSTAKFGAIWVRVGLMGDLGATYWLPRMVGPSKAFELFATGDIISAQEAERIGLLTKVVPPEELMPAVKDMANKLAKGPLISIKFQKKAVYKGLQNDLLRQLDFESYGQNMCRQTEDHKEGVKAFMEKRPAQFKGI
jgi:enoyl-CoA hydratase/carnithine racemase